MKRADGSVGQYSVPAVVIYPRHGHGNRVGVVDWLNSAFYHFFPPATEFATHQFTLLSTGNYLFEQGYTYLSIQWNKAVTEIFGPAAPPDGQPHNHLVYGSIDRSADAWEILRDAARLLKDPSDYPGHGGPKRVATVLSSGYSQGAALQLELLAERLDPTRVYDGHLVQMIGLTCWKREDVAPHFGFMGDCRPLPTERPRAGHRARVGDRHGGLPPDGPPLREERVLRPQSDRSQLAPVRDGRDLAPAQADLPGRCAQPEHRGRAAHLPRGPPEPDPVDARPAPCEASGIAPLPGSVDATDAFIPTTDADGHFAGGLRLPHVESTVHGREAGAPLGLYRPLNPLGENPLHPFKFISGTFTRFNDVEIIGRYASRDQFVKRVKCAADHLAARRYITLKDRNALIAGAKVEPLPLPPTDDDGNDFTTDLGECGPN